MAYEDRKKKREAKFRDIIQDTEGNIVYTGDLWRIADSEEAGSGRRQRITLIAVIVVIALAVIGSGFIDSKNAIGSFYVVLPYIGEVSALFGLAWNAVKVLLPSGGVRTSVLEHARPMIPGACRILTVFALAGLLFSGIYMMRHGAGDKMLDSIAYLMLKVAAAALAEWFCRRFNLTEWEKI